MLSRSLIVFLATLAAAPLNAASVGQRAPNVPLTNTAKQTRNLQDFKGSVVFVDFWASWCAPCQQELRALNRLAREYPGQRLKVLAINLDQDRKAAHAALARLGLSEPAFEVFWDSYSRAAKAFDLPTMPSSYLIDRDGTIRAIHAGFHPQDPAAWRSEINALK